MAGKDKSAKAGKQPATPKPGKGAKPTGGGLLFTWTVAHGVIFGGLFWFAWLAVERSPGESLLSVAWPWMAAAAVLFLTLMFNIANAMAAGAAATAQIDWSKR